MLVSFFRLDKSPSGMEESWLFSILNSWSWVQLANAGGSSMSWLYLMASLQRLVNFPMLSGSRFNWLCCRLRFRNALQFPILSGKDVIWLWDRSSVVNRVRQPMDSGMLFFREFWHTIRQVRFLSFPTPSMLLNLLYFNIKFSKFDRLHKHCGRLPSRRLYRRSSCWRRFRFAISLGNFASIFCWIKRSCKLLNCPILVGKLVNLLPYKYSSFSQWRSSNTLLGSCWNSSLERSSVGRLNSRQSDNSLLKSGSFCRFILDLEFTLNFFPSSGGR